MDKTYVVQTSQKIVERCVLMATDPGDLVLDPTCGSGTTAYVAERWGRRWITVDTSRVALALARARIMGARYPFYLLADSREGQRKEAEVSRTVSSSQPVRGDIRQGFVYERVPHITLKSIVSNAELDVIWGRWQSVLEPLREKLNATLKKRWQEWEIPRAAEAQWAEAAKKLHADWWQAHITRQKEIDASISAKAEFEHLYDRPYEDKKTVRVAGPFTVESLSPHRVLGVDENDELIDGLKERKGAEYGAKQSFPQMILENLKTAGVQQAHKEDRITFTALTPWPGYLVCADGRYMEGDSEKRAAIFIGPEFGTVQRADLVEAAREAGDAGFDVLIACAFNYEAHTTEFTKLGRINYRTSHQIRTQADRLLGPIVTDVDGNTEDRSDTISVFNGPPPMVRSLKTKDEEVSAVGAWLAERAATGVLPHEFGVFVRSDAQIDRARAAVGKAGMAFRILDEHVETTHGHASICTMHLSKGLEFRAVAVMACDDEIIPLQERIENVGDDADLQEVYDTERQLLYVACTRARDHLLVTGVEPVSEFLDDFMKPGRI
jgi:hypothetical protein